MKKIIVITLLLLLTVLSHGQNQPAPRAEAVLSSQHLIPGESTTLWLLVHGDVPDHQPTAPKIDTVAINFIQALTRIDENRNLTQAFVYRVTPSEPGTFTIPPVNLTTKNNTLPTKPVRFQVHPATSLTEIPTSEDQPPVKIGFYPGKTTLYQGEVTPLTLKVYAPGKLNITNFGLPTPKKNNTLAWRFSLPERHQLTETTLDGTRHRVATYSTNLSGIEPGTANYGPTELRLISRKSIIDPIHGPRLTEKPINLTIPATSFKILPLPDNAPTTFNGAIGNFTLNATCAKTTLKQTDTTEVILTISGTGNLPNIQAPTLTEDTWKIIDTSKVTRGKERRQTTGTVTFRQLLRPKTTSSIPPYQFTFFNTDTRAYQTLTTPPIATTITQTSTTTPPESPNIQPFIKNPTTSISLFTIHSSLFFHLIPATLALLILGIHFRGKHLRQRASRPDIAQKKQALKELQQTSDTQIFYRRAGRIIDQWLTPNQETSNIIKERDALCFLPENAPNQAIEPERKKQIIEILQRCIKPTLGLILLLTLPGNSHASAQDAWLAGNYQQAIKLYQQQYPDPQTTPADILYNIGNCHFHLEKNGHAALAWRRALINNPSHQQARQNLRFTEQAQQALVPRNREWLDHLTILHPNTYRLITYTSLWIIALSILILVCTRKNKALAISLAAIATLVTTLSILAEMYYPNDTKFAPLNQQAVLLEKSTLYPEPHRTPNNATLKTTPLTLPPASLVKIIAQRGPWTHIQTSDNQSGWLPAHTIGQLIP